jgi:hypothetical protein
MTCLEPKVTELPEGSWMCPLCAVCRTCGKQSEQKPATGDLAALVANRTTKQADVPAADVPTEFHHATVPTPLPLIPRNGAQTYAATYCTPCSADWEADRFCPVCLVTYADDQNDIKMVCCDICDRWVHIECDPAMNEAKYEAMMRAKDAKWVDLIRHCSIPLLTFSPSFHLLFLSHFFTPPTTNRYTCPPCHPGDAWQLTKPGRAGRKPLPYKGHPILV